MRKERHLQLTGYVTGIGYSYARAITPMANPEKQQAVDFGLKEWYDDKAGTYSMPLEVFENDAEVRAKVLRLLCEGKLYKRVDDDSTRWGLWEEDNLHHFTMDVYDLGSDGKIVAIGSNDF